jgi:hypothetical protein
MRDLPDGCVRVWGVAFPGEEPLTCCIAWTPSVSVPVLCKTEAEARSVERSIPSTPLRPLETRAFIAAPTPAFDALLDKAGRVEGLERKVAALRGVLGEARGVVSVCAEHGEALYADMKRDLVDRIDALLAAAKRVGG